VGQSLVGGSRCYRVSTRPRTSHGRMRGRPRTGGCVQTTPEISLGSWSADRFSLLSSQDVTGTWWFYWDVLRASSSSTLGTVITGPPAPYSAMVTRGTLTTGGTVVTRPTVSYRPTVGTSVVASQRAVLPVLQSWRCASRGEPEVQDVG
jgi:hypothetical protein